MTHPIQRRYWAENLVRLRRSDEQQRYAASQRRGRIDPNPHQIDAVVFALRRIREGGCILADEVGLGKTIEAGLVIAQLMAEGFRRILIILPKPLMGQWQNELYTLFGIQTREGRSDVESYAGDGVFLVGREAAGSERIAGLLRTSAPFDLCVIDEAHEIFAGIYKRYSADGVYRGDSDDAQTAHRVRSFLGAVPVMLLTATPIQNSMAELWGLVQYVEPTGTLLGNIATFRDLFCEPGTNDRVLVAEQAHELRRRINTVCQRTLRRQAQEFLDRPFTRRQAVLFEYEMSAEEKSLYDDVTQYLMSPSLCAFSGSQRRLLLLSFHRLMASSQRAFANSLQQVIRRLTRIRDGDEASEPVALEAVEDLDDELTLDTDRDGADDHDAEVAEQTPAFTPEQLASEMALVAGFVQRAKFLSRDSKAERLKDAVRMVLQRGESGEGSGKVVIFTEFVTTQDYLRDVLLGGSLGLSDQDITRFRGTNDSPRAMEAVAAWRQEVAAHLPASSRPSPQVAVRLALVHEFQTKSRVFISTEAGAKGLNLQFCDTIINYDLPWNPQRIEQRIGRCHRYRQARDVTVINFVAAGNEAQRLTLEILIEKLDLFGKVLDASDQVLHQPTTDAPETVANAVGADFQAQLGRIFDRARSPAELAAEIRQLAEAMGERRRQFEETQSRMARLIESRLDDSVRQVFRKIADQLQESFAELDLSIERVVCSYLDEEDVAYTRRIDEEGRVVIQTAPSPRLPEELSCGIAAVIGRAKGLEDIDPLHSAHPLVLAAVADARRRTEGRCRVRFETAEGLPELRQLQGRSGRLVVTKLSYSGFEPAERLLLTAMLDNEIDPLDPQLAQQLLELPTTDLPAATALPPIAEEDLEDALEEAVFLDQSESAKLQQQRFERMVEQLERHAEDQLMVLRRQLASVAAKLSDAQDRRSQALGADARRTAERQVERLEAQWEALESRLGELQRREDDQYQRCRDAAHQRRYAAPTTERVLDVEFLIQ